MRSTRHPLAAFLIWQPFIYTQLVAFSCVIYLMCHAFLLGLANTADESITFGLVIPMLNCTLTTVSVFGLLEVGPTTCH